jgi:xanthine dehydrogenase iron-sulfur cluster and FAD-binding subunit A
LRCLGVEDAVRGRSVADADLENTVRIGRAALAREAKPIDDIRSTAMYRSTVAANLLEQFLRQLSS